MKRSFRAAMIWRRHGIATPALADKDHGRDKSTIARNTAATRRPRLSRPPLVSRRDERRPAPSAATARPVWRGRNIPLPPPGHARRYYQPRRHPAAATITASAITTAMISNSGATGTITATTTASIAWTAIPPHSCGDQPDRRLLELTKGRGPMKRGGKFPPPVFPFGAGLGVEQEMQNVAVLDLVGFASTGTCPPREHKPRPDRSHNRHGRRSRRG